MANHIILTFTQAGHGCPTVITQKEQHKRDPRQGWRGPVSNYCNYNYGSHSMQGARSQYINQRGNYLCYIILAYESKDLLARCLKFVKGRTPPKTYKCFDLCYSFKVLCRAEYGGTWQLHLAAKNYMHNYTTGLHQNQQITYKRALWNLMVLMFLHYINHLESTGALEGHWTLIAHECLMVAVALGCFHQWQRWVELERLG